MGSSFASFPIVYKSISSGLGTFETDSPKVKKNPQRNVEIVIEIVEGVEMINKDGIDSFVQRKYDRPTVINFYRFD